MITLNAVQKLHSPYRSIHKCIKFRFDKVALQDTKMDKKLFVN